MIIKLSEGEINYEVYGNGKNIIFLHGWGCDLSIFKRYSSLPSGKVYLIDLPGFGKSSTPKRAFDTLDYANILKEFIDELKIDDPILIGHSFGGKVVLKYESMYKSSKCILIAPSIFKPKRDFSYYIKVYTYKVLKRIGLNLNMGSNDYKMANGIMKNILINVCNEDLSDDVLLVESDVLIMWGVDDETVPIDDGYKLNSLLKNSGIVAIPNCKHYPFIENEGYFRRVLESFIGDR